MTGARGEANSGPPFRTERLPAGEGGVGLAVGVSGDPAAGTGGTGGTEDKGEPVVALHGITAHHRAFNALARRVSGASTGRAVIAPDLRGRGDSGKPETGYGIEAHAADVVRLLDHFGLESATLVGHSMGAFVALQAALSYPERVKSLVLLDGGWPRSETPPQEMSEEQKREAEAVREGLARAFRRLDMTFENPGAYLDFWFPGEGLTPADLPPDVADYFLYDLGEVERGFSPKCSSTAAVQDSEWLSSRGPTAEELRGVGCPVRLVTAGSGFFPGSEPLVSDEAQRVMFSALDLRYRVRLTEANHYTMLHEPGVGEIADLLLAPGDS